MAEKHFQAKLIRELRDLGFTVWKNQQNATTELARPDLIVMKGVFWGCLEVKKEEKAPHRPFQDMKVKGYNNMSYARFVYPENKDGVLTDIVKIATERNEAWENYQTSKKGK